MKPIPVINVDQDFRRDDPRWKRNRYFQLPFPKHLGVGEILDTDTTTYCRVSGVWRFKLKTYLHK